MNAGICGFWTIVDTTMQGELCALSIESNCISVQSLAGELTLADPMQGISFRGLEPQAL